MTLALLEHRDSLGIGLTGVVIYDPGSGLTHIPHIVISLAFGTLTLSAER